MHVFYACFLLLHHTTIIYYSYTILIFINYKNNFFTMNHFLVKYMLNFCYISIFTLFKYCLLYSAIYYFATMIIINKCLLVNLFMNFELALNLYKMIIILNEIIITIIILYFYRQFSYCVTKVNINIPIC